MVDGVIQSGAAITATPVMAGLVPAIHGFCVRPSVKTWMVGTRAAMTVGRAVIFVLATWLGLCAAALAADLPPDSVTHHVRQFPGRTLYFTATAGAIHLTDERNSPQADVAYVSYALRGTDSHLRPVTFVFNGGPGMSSAWLHVGAVGPWRIPLQGMNGVPSAPAEPDANDETWLDFTDLVFIDPPGTGYSRIVAGGDDARRRMWSVNGDLDIAAEVIRRWLVKNDRVLSPKYLLGESYGGFRAAQLPRVLQSQKEVGVNGVILISPLLDLHQESGGVTDPMPYVYRLPSYTAAARALDGPVTRASLADAEEYATTGYIQDLLRGDADHDAAERMSERVAALTGLDLAVVRRYGGRLDTDVFLHELERGSHRVGSQYDATITSPDPFPNRPLSQYPDPVLQAYKAPVTSAMLAVYAEMLQWRPDASYVLENDGAFSQWDWGRGMGRPEAVTPLETAMALDPRMRVMIVHGLFDVRTPYFASLLELRGMSQGPRVEFRTYTGGHMFYVDDSARAAFRSDARALYPGPGR